MRGARHHAFVLLALLCPFATACSVEGDFGRRQPSVVTDTIMPAIGRYDASKRGEPVSTLPLTDDETELRDRAWRFLSPAYPHSSYEAMLAALRTSRITPPESGDAGPSAYFVALSSLDWRSSTGPYQRLIADISADQSLLDPYDAVLARVIAADDIRRRGLPFVADLTEAQRARVLARIAENQFLAAWVDQSLRERVAAYRYALQHLFVALPDRDGVAAERLLARLGARIAAG
jgi:hypothetical protein